MGANLLTEALKAHDAAKGKKSNGYYEGNSSIISYSTGIPVLDYNLGYRLSVSNTSGEIVDTYPMVGITGGSYCLLIGKPGTAKTSAAVTIAGNIIRPFDNGLCLHIDFEGAMNYTRIHNITKIPMNNLRDKYILRNEKVTLEDMKTMITDLYVTKTSNPDTFKYNTGKLNEFGEEIITYVPSVVIIDSIATITTGIGSDAKSIEKMEEVMSQTERMRLTGEIGRFFSEILAPCREANIIVIAINQIKTNPGVGPFGTPPMVLGLGQSDALPGGWGPVFNAQILIKFVVSSSGKFSVEDDGFSGFKIDANIIKSRVSESLKVVQLVFDRNRGIDSLRTSVEYAKDLGLVTGTRANYHFTLNGDNKFKQKTMHDDFKNNPELYKVLKDTIMPVLDSGLAGVSEDELNNIPDEEENFYNI